MTATIVYGGIPMSVVIEILKKRAAKKAGKGQKETKK
jgi:hypothetical protein